MHRALSQNDSISRENFDMDCLGIRLREERHRYGLSQQAFADMGQVKTHAQALYESGKRTPRADYLTAVSAIGVDVLYIVQASGARIRSPSMTKTELL